MTFKEWKIEYDIPDIPRDLLDAGYNPLLAYILAIRGCDTAAKAKEMFVQDTSAVHSPMLMKDMDKAVARISEAIKNNEKIAVYGDYDVDGITSTCLLSDYLIRCGLDVTPYIPDRSEEGYGLNYAAIDGFSNNGISLIVTVDCGITAFDETKYASERGIDMIITDHHECKEELPSACAVIDYKRLDDSYPEKTLAGVGVAFKLVCACSGNSMKMLERYSDLLAIGTIADVMPLIGENRCFVRSGLKALKEHPRPGISAILKESSIDKTNISASTIGFILSPRLNAAGRLGQAITAEKLIMSTDENKASSLAKKLCELNRERQSIENEIWREAGGLLEGKKIATPIVLCSRQWHQGVIGIAASRLAERYGLPTIMIYINEDGIGKGSCRSYGGFNLFDALSACSDHLISFGGHALAAGLNINEDKITEFRIALGEYYMHNKPDHQPDICCDLLINDAEILSIDNVRSLDLLEPYGNCNPKPVMCISGARLERSSAVGGGKHLKMKVSANGRKFDAIFFSHNAEELGIAEGDLIDIAFTPQINEFRGLTSVQLLVSACRPHDGRELCRDILENGCSYIKAAKTFRPERTDFIKVWRQLVKTGNAEISSEDIESAVPDGMSPEKYCLCLKIFEEAGLLSSVYGGVPVDRSEKADLDSTELMERLNNAV